MILGLRTQKSQTLEPNQVTQGHVPTVHMWVCPQIGGPLNMGFGVSYCFPLNYPTKSACSLNQTYIPQSSALLSPFLGEGSPTKTDKREKQLVPTYSKLSNLEVEAGHAQTTRRAAAGLRLQVPAAGPGASGGHRLRPSLRSLRAVHGGREKRRALHWDFGEGKPWAKYYKGIRLKHRGILGRGNTLGQLLWMDEILLGTTREPLE